MFWSLFLCDVCLLLSRCSVCLSSLSSSINNKKSNQLSSVLQNSNHKYYNHNINIKCVDSIIKYKYFESIHYIINLNVVSSFIIFNDFDYTFLFIYL